MIAILEFGWRPQGTMNPHFVTIGTKDTAFFIRIKNIQNKNKEQNKGYCLYILFKVTKHIVYSY